MHPHYDVIVVGAGFAGIRTAQLLRENGFSFRGIERSSRIGGVWANTCYPGARCDSPAPYYQILDQELANGWSWSQRFPDRADMLNYFAYVDSKWKISENFDFGVAVSNTVFDENDSTWKVSVSDGRTLVARWLVLGVGLASKISIPNIQGLDSFQGSVLHTGEWPESDYDLENKRVAVIGTGASAVQVIQEITPRVASLTVYQRRPAVVLPRSSQIPEDTGPFSLTSDERTLFIARALSTRTGLGYDLLNSTGIPAGHPQRRVYNDYLYNKGQWHFICSNFADLWYDKSANKDVYSFWVEQNRSKIDDPVKRDLLVPIEPKGHFGIQRPCLADNYLELFNLPHVGVVDTTQDPLREVTETGIYSGDMHREYDLIIFATGFQPLESQILSLNISGRNGQKLETAWKASSSSFLGMAVPGFPNMFYLNGPEGPNTRTNAPTVIERQSQWIVSTIRYLHNSGIQGCEATDAAAWEWRQEIEKQWQASLFPSTPHMPTPTRTPDATWISGLDNYGTRLNECQPPVLAGFSQIRGKPEITNKCVEDHCSKGEATLASQIHASAA